MKNSAEQIKQFRISLEESETIEVSSGDREPSSRLNKVGKQWIISGLKLLEKRERNEL